MARISLSQQRGSSLGALAGAVAATLFVFVSHARAAGVAEGDSPPSPVVTIGSDTSLPGGAVLIPVALRLPEKMQIISLSLEIPVAKSLLKLKWVRASLATEMAGATVSWDLKDMVPPGAGPALGSADQKVLQDIAVIGVKVVGKNALPTGTIAILDFRIADDTGDTSIIALNPEKISMARPQGLPVPEIKSQPGEIKISKSPPTFVNCFFFSH